MYSAKTNVIKGKTITADLFLVLKRKLIKIVCRLPHTVAKRTTVPSIEDTPNYIVTYNLVRIYRNSRSPKSLTGAGA